MYLAIDKSIPLGRMIEPEEVAKAALYLDLVTRRGATGVVLNVDGGYTLK